MINVTEHGVSHYILQKKMRKIRMRFNNINNFVNLENYIDNIEKGIGKLNDSSINVSKHSSEHLLMLRKLHKVLKNGQNLSSKQRLDYCDSERYFMKLYLRELNKS
jgi:hypothetical protein